MTNQSDERLTVFIDILGFKKMIFNRVNLQEKNDIFEILNYFKEYEKSSRWGIKAIEIEEDAQRKGIENFEIKDVTNCTCFSDSIVISVKFNKNRINEAFSTLVANLSEMGSHLMRRGILIRGGITVGELFHNKKGIVFGRALIEAYELESKISIYPRIVISKKLINRLNYILDNKKDRYPYHQYLERFKDGIVGFHQMKVLEVIQGAPTLITDEELKKYLKETKDVIVKGLDIHFEEPAIFNKYTWLKEEYNKLIIFNDDGNIKKERIREPSESDSRHNVHYSYINNNFL